MKWDIQTFLSLFVSKLLGNECKEIILSPLQEEDRTQNLARYSVEPNIRCTDHLQDCAVSAVSDYVTISSQQIDTRAEIMKLASM
jgi:hypothetical protein